MTYRAARRGAAVAGSILFAMPVSEMLVGLGTAGPLHFVVGAMGIALIAVALSGRFL